MLTVLELNVSTPLWILKPLVSCSAAAHRCHLSSLLFSPLTLLPGSHRSHLCRWVMSARRETFREWLQPPLSPSLHPLHSSLVRQLAAVQTRLKASLTSSIKTPWVIMPLSATRWVLLSCHLETSQPFNETGENGLVAQASCVLKVMHWWYNIFCYQAMVITQYLFIFCELNTVLWFVHAALEEVSALLASVLFQSTKVALLWWLFIVIIALCGVFLLHDTLSKQTENRNQTPIQAQIRTAVE